MFSLQEISLFYFDEADAASHKEIHDILYNYNEILAVSKMIDGWTLLDKKSLSK